MIDHDGEVSLALAVADLVDPDPPQPIKQIDLAHRLGRDTLEDRADRPPRDAHQLRDRGLRRVHRQPRDLVLERPREPRAMPRPRHRAHDNTMAPARHPRRLGLHERERRAEIQRTPPPAALAEVETRRPAPAHPAAIPLSEARPDAHDHLALAAEPDVLNDNSAQPEQPRPYPDTAHAVSAPSGSGREEARTLGTARHAPFLSRSPHPRKRQERLKKHVPNGVPS